MAASSKLTIGDVADRAFVDGAIDGSFISRLCLRTAANWQRAAQFIER